MNYRATLTPTNLSLLLALSGCGSNGTGFVTQTGTIVSYAPCATATPVPAATVTIGSRAATTASDGTYSIQVPSGTSFTMMVTAANYAPLIEADDTVTAGYDRGDTLLIPSEIASILEGALANFDATQSLLTIELVKTGSCTDVGGTTVAVSPSNASAVTDYPSQCITPVGGTSATDGVFPTASAAVVYNLTPGKHTVTATSPKCTQIPYPYTDPTTGLTYDGTVTTQAGTGDSFIRVFLK